MIFHKNGLCHRSVDVDRVEEIIKNSKCFYQLRLVCAADLVSCIVLTLQFIMKTIPSLSVCVF